MKKFSRQIKDKVSDLLKDPNTVVDINTENIIVEALLGGEPWPIRWKRMTFNPGGDLGHSVMMLNHFFGNDPWSLLSDDPKVGYVAWVKAEEYSVFAQSAERALLLAIWNAWRLEHDDTTE